MRTTLSRRTKDNDLTPRFEGKPYIDNHESSTARRLEAIATDQQPKTPHNYLIMHRNQMLHRIFLGAPPPTRLWLGTRAPQRLWIQNATTASMLQPEGLKLDPDLQ